MTNEQAATAPAPRALQEPPGINRLILSGSIRERSAMRYTPAGLPAVDLVIEHRSVVQEEGVARKVTMDCKAVCIGTLAARAHQQALGRELVFQGFLAPARSGRGHVFHITGLQTPPDDDPAAVSPMTEA